MTSPAFGLAAALMIADGCAAALAQKFLALPIRVTDWFHLALHLDDGVVLGTLPMDKVGAAYWTLAVVAPIWMVWGNVTTPWLVDRVGYALVLAGLVGNAARRLRGPVPDYFGVGPLAGDTWLFFNVADVTAVAGFLFLSGAFARAILKGGRRAPGRRGGLGQR